MECLQDTPLSFYDTFECVSGVPAFLLTPGDGEMRITCCAFSRDGSRLATGHEGGSVCIWDVCHGKRLAQKDNLHSMPISDITFQGNMPDVVLTADRTGLCMQWDMMRSVGEVTELDLATLQTPSVDSDLSTMVNGQSMHFCGGGSRVIFAAMVEFARAGSGAYVANVPNSYMRFFVVDTEVFPELRCIAQMSVDVSSIDVVTQIALSPDRKGLLVGFTNSQVEEGFVILWPDFESLSDVQVHLPHGTLGDWAPDSCQVVTWTVPEEPFPQDNDGCCAFLWDVQGMREQMQSVDWFPDEGRKKVEDQEPIELRNPFGKNVLWCRFVIDEVGKSRLVMCVIRTTARLLFWDIETETLTHVIPTGISTNDVILGSRECWQRCWVGGEFIKGLDPLAVSSDMKWMGAVSGHQNRAVIWDAAQGVELLNITLPENLSDAVGIGVDLILSHTSGNFAIVGDESILVFLPAARANKSLQSGSNARAGHQAVELNYFDASNTNEARVKMAFSCSGDVLGVLHVGSASLHLWNVHDGTYLALTDGGVGEFPVSYGDFLDFALTVDFSLSAVESSLLVTYTTSREMLIWNCSTSAQSIVGVIHSEDPGLIQGIGFLPGAETIVTCESSGDLVWYSLDDASKRSRDIHSFSRDGVDEPLLRTASRDSLTESRTWISRSNTSRVFKAPRRIRSEINRNSEHAGSVLRFSLREFERKHALGNYRCRFSADCSIAVLMPDPARAYVWDLEGRCVIQTVSSEGNEEVVTAPSFSRSATLMQELIADPKILSHVDPNVQAIVENFQLFDASKTIVMSEDKNVFLLPGSCGFSHREDQGVSQDHSLFKQRKTRQCNSVYVVNSKRPDCTRRLCGRKLEPWKGMAMSADGRVVACISSGTTCSKVIVWNCYASSSLLPTFRSLEIRNCVQSKRQVMENVPLLLNQFGGNLFNFVHPHGASLVMDSVDQVNDEMLDVILQYAAKQEIKVSLEADGEGENAVELALGKGSPEVASKLMKYLMERVTHEGQLARILKQTFVPLNENYHKIFIKTLHHPKLFSTITDLRLPEAMMAQGQFMESTSDLLFATEEDAEEIWRNRCNEELDEPDPVTTKAIVKVLPYPNACQIGQEGLLRTMLVNGASDVCFASFAVKSIVTHKWRKYAERYFRREFMYYGVLLLAFTVYSFLLYYQDTYNAATGKGNEENEWETIVALGFCWILAVPKLVEEFMQTHFYWSGYGLKGIYYWLSSGWNWMEMLCYFMIIFVIPAGQFWIFKEGKRTTVLSAIVAVESILLWFKMLYFARPFRKTGPLVIIVSAIAKDIMPFLILAACVMFGFTVAFFVLFRHFKSGASGSSIDPQTASEESPAGPPENMEDIEFSFGNFGRTLFTVTGYMFGEFDSRVIFGAPEQATAIALFMLYMVIITIILLNMLIAIMGDSFNRIKSSEEMQFIKARAVAIDDMESMLSFKQKEALESSVGRYLHVAIPKYLHNKIITYRKKRLARRSGRVDRSQDKMHQILSTLNRLVRKNTGADRMELQRMEPDFMEDLLDQDDEFDPLADPTAEDATDASSTSSSSIEGEGGQDEDSLSSFSSRD